LLLFVFFTYTLDNIWENLKNEPAVIWQVLFCIMVPFLQLIYFYMAHHRERFLLTSSGIQYQSPMPFFLQWLKPDWSIKWSMLKTAYFKPAKLGRGFQSVFMIIETTLVSQKIIPCVWIDPNDSEQIRSFSRWQLFHPQQTKHTLPYCPIVKYFTRMGIEVKTDQIDIA
jgi:hypothetical protein